MTYEQALAYIAGLEGRGWRLGLDRMQEFIRRAGLEDALGPPSGPRFIHVAGTNGKGSTTAYLQSILVESGYRTGAFFSPYVVDPRERIQFNREMIAPDELAELTERLIPPAESLSETEFGGITEFEFKTALGFAHWQRQQCEWVALEVGLGGRLDATNVVHPSACVITSIGLDHTQILGSTEAEIAREKAGIVKPCVPVIIGPMSEEALGVIQEVAASARSPLWRFGDEVRWNDGQVTTPVGSHRNAWPSMRGEHQKVNVSLAVAAVDAAGASCSEAAIELGAKRAFAPGRMQEVAVGGKRFIFDGAHNAQSAELLAATLRQEFPGAAVVLVTNMLQGHTLEDFYGPLLPLCESAFVVPISFHRARSVEETAQAIRGLGCRAEPCGSVQEGLARAAQAGDIVVVTGSFYLVGEALRSL